VHWFQNPSGYAEALGELYERATDSP